MGTGSGPPLRNLDSSNDRPVPVPIFSPRSEYLVVSGIAPALRALLDRLIDYAGMFPPASLPPAAAIANYQSYQSGEHAWMLRWLVVGAAELGQVPPDLDGSLAVLSDADQPRAAVIEAKRIVRA